MGWYVGPAPYVSGHANFLGDARQSSRLRAISGLWTTSILLSSLLVCALLKVCLLCCSAGDVSGMCLTWSRS